MDKSEYSKKFEYLKTIYGLDNIIKVLDSFSKLDRDFFVLYYGINCEAQTQEKIKNTFNTSRKVVSTSLQNSLSTIEKTLNVSRTIPTYTKKEAFYQLFPNFSINQINAEIDKLNDRDKDIIINCFELNDSPAFSQAHLANNYAISTSTISYIIRSTIKKIQKNLNNENTNKYKLKELYKDCNQEDFQFAYLFLSIRNQEIFNLYYGIYSEKEYTLDEIGEKYNITPGTVNNYIQKCHTRINQILENLERIEAKFTTFNDPNVDLIKNELSLEEVKIINSYKNRKSTKDFLKKICQEKQINMTKTIIYCNEIEKNIIKKMKLYTDPYKNFETFKELFKNSHPSYIKFALTNLDERKQNILYLYFGLNGNKCLTMQEIANIHGLSKARIGAIIKSSIIKMKKFLETIEDNSFVSSEANLNINIEKKYSKEEICKALMYFSDRNQDIIQKKIGLKKSKIFTEKYIANQYNLTEEGIKNILMTSLPTFINILEKNIIYNLDSKITNLLNIYGLENTMWAINQLDQSSKKLFCMHYGICGYQFHSLQQLEYETNINELELSFLIDDTYEKILNKIALKQKKEEQQKKYDEFLNKLRTKNKKDIEMALQYLTPSEYNFLNSYYNLDGKDCTKSDSYLNFKYNEKEVNIYLKKIISKLNNILVKNR